MNKPKVIRTFKPYEPRDTEGVMYVCKTCGIQFWADNPRKYCSMQCFKDKTK